MNELFKTHQSFTFKSLDLNQILVIVKNFIEIQLPNVEGILNTIIIYIRDLEIEVSFEDALRTYKSGQFDMIYFRVKSRWGNGNELHILIRQRPDSISIMHSNLNPESGREVVANIIKDLNLIDIYDFHLLKIKNKAERSYMQEALICKNSGAFRAAVIMGWTCVMNRVYSQLERKHKTDFILQIKQRHKNDKKFRLKAIVKLEDYQQFKDREILEISADLFLNKGLAKRLQEFLDLRNDCAHVRVWQPSSTLADAFFEEIFANVF